MYFPPEWQSHAACWLAFPYREAEWSGALADAQGQFAALARAIVGPGDEALRILVPDAAVQLQAQSLIGNDSKIEWIHLPYGDCWTRDTLPIFGRYEAGACTALRFRFNGWGERYVMPGDSELAQRVIDLLGLPENRVRQADFVCEGGAIEHNGAGQGVVISASLLDQRRNPSLVEDDAERILREALDLQDLIWIESGLALDHTGGHTDMVARFVNENTLVYTRPQGEHADVGSLSQIETTLKHAADERDLALLPLPAPTANPALPENYCNFYIANRAVLVPQFGCAQDPIALQILRTAFPKREILGLASDRLLIGGGSFHCVTQSQYSAS